MLNKKPQLFISHSARREEADPLVATVLKELSEQLKETWEVFVDENCIEAGSRWRPIILHKLSKSQAGIILFDRNALANSPWLRAESLILCFRKSVSPNFELIPILFGDLNVNETCFNDYEPFQLNEIQAIKIKDETGKQKLFEVIEKRLIEKTPPPIAEDINGWRNSFKRCVKQIDTDGLNETWSELPYFCPDAENISGADFERYLLQGIVQSFHHFSPFETLNATRSLSEILKKESENFKDVCKLLMNKWVENELIEVFFNLQRTLKKKILLTYNLPNDNDNEIIKYLFDRIYYERPRGQSFIPITLPKDKIEEALFSKDISEKNRKVEFLIRNEIETRLGSKGKLARCRIGNYKTDKLVIIYIPQKIAQTNILKNLLQDYEDIVFLVQAGEQKDNDDEFDNLGGRKLTPQLTEDKLDDFLNLELLLTHI